MEPNPRTLRQHYLIADRFITLLSNAAPVCAADESGLPVAATDPSAKYFDPVSAMVRIGHESSNLRVISYELSVSIFGNSTSRQTRSLMPWYSLFSRFYGHTLFAGEEHVAVIRTFLGCFYTPTIAFRERLKRLQLLVLPHHLAGAGLQYDAVRTIRA